MGTGAYELVARVVKTRGKEGKVTAVGAGGLPCFLHEGLRVHVVPPSLYGPRELVVGQVEELPSGECIVCFQGIGHIAAAEELTGKHLLAAVDDLDVDWAELPAWWLGRQVQDERFGELGCIEELIETPAHDVWVVRGVRGEVLVPAVEEFVVDVPANQQEPIRTCIPDGLL